MKLERWIARERLTQAKFAARVGVSQGLVSLWISGGRLPGRALVEIIRVTRGKVGPKDFGLARSAKKRG